MPKVKITFKKKVEIGDKVLEGEMSFNKPDMGIIIDAGNICPPTNPIGFTSAVIAAIIDVPYTSIRAMDPADFMSLQEPMEPLLPTL